MDLRVIHLRKILPIAKMLDVPGPPHRFYISGPSAAEVSAVEINGDQGYAWTAIGSNVVAIDLPHPFMVRTVAVLGREMGDAKEAECYFGFTKFLTTTRGLQKLVQDWLKCFLSTPGTDPFSLKWGGGGLGIVKRSSSAEGPYNSALAIAVRETTKQMIARQALDTNSPSSEKLLNAKLLKISMSADRTGYTADIEITSQAGTKARVGVSPLDTAA